MKGWP